MSETKKPHNAANAMFGLDDVPEQRRPQNKAPSGTPRAAAEGAGGTAGFGFPQAPSVSFGPARTAPAAQAPPAEDAREASSQAAQYGRGAAPYETQGAASPTPQVVYVPAPPSSTPGWIKPLLLVLLLVAAATLIFGVIQSSKFSNLLSKQADQINLLSRRADSSDERYAQLSAKFQVEAERLGMTRQELLRARQLASRTEKQEQQAVQQLNSAISQKASAQQLNQLQSAATTQFGQLSGSIAGTQKDLQSTQEALTGAKGELSGAIARTHSELVALAHRTDRDYFEFHVNKGTRQKIGSLQVQLLKANSKHNFFTVNLFFDDKVSQRKDEAIDEPVFFYMQGAQSALELVVNKLGKNFISGYVSAPKGFITNAPSVLGARPTA